MSGISSEAMRIVSKDGSKTVDVELKGSKYTLAAALYDSSGNQMDSFAGITGIGHGSKTVAVAGTDEALATSTTCKRVIVQALTDNTGFIAVGGSGVDATVATGSGVLLVPGSSVEIDIDNLSDIYIDATVSGDGVRFTYFS